MEARLSLESGFESEGPLLITHWGLSGPAILQVSSYWQRGEDVPDIMHALEEKAQLLMRRDQVADG